MNSFGQFTSPTCPVVELSISSRTSGHFGLTKAMEIVKLGSSRVIRVTQP